jgi:tellurite resistance protein TerC
MWLMLAGFAAVCIAADARYLNPTDTHLSGRRRFINVLLIVLAACVIGVALLALTQFGWPGVAKYGAGYMSEMSLSLDNLFVMTMLLRQFGVKAQHERTVLLLSIVGTVVLRFVIILCGLSLLERFEFVGAIFGLWLGYVVVRSIVSQGKPEKEIKERASYKFMVQVLHLPVTDQHYGAKLIALEADGHRRMTPLGQCAIMMVFMGGVVFSFDSIPVVLAVTNNLFLAVASNVMAVIGLLSFLAAYRYIEERLPYIEYGVWVILGWVMIDLVIGNGQVMGWFHLPHLSLPLAVTPGIIVTVLLSTWIAGLIWRPTPKPQTAAE